MLGFDVYNVIHLAAFFLKLRFQAFIHLFWQELERQFEQQNRHHAVVQPAQNRNHIWHDVNRADDINSC